MVTAAGVAHANRIPVLLLPGDTFQGRAPDPVLQQIESFGDPTITVNDAFKSVSRYWDRIMRPEQIIHSLPHAVAVMLNPADCGPAVLAHHAGSRRRRRFWARAARSSSTSLRR
jgi:3D-(3,5/4)-trihydroxycyclohexane-1,2-dione acylhydrolase (decyclizing)